MIKLKIISLFLSLLLTLQMLPIAQIGQMLSTNQWTEELPHNADEASKEGSSVSFHPFLPPQNYLTASSVFAENKAIAYIHYSEQIPFNHSTEIVSPPPDFAS